MEFAWTNLHIKEHSGEFNKEGIVYKAIYFNSISNSMSCTFITVIKKTRTATKGCNVMVSSCSMKVMSLFL